MDLRELAPDEEQLTSDVALTPENSGDAAVNEAVQSNLVPDETTHDEVVAESKELTKDSIIVRLKEISDADGSEIGREEVSRLKQVFFNIRKAELQAEKQAFIDAGNEETAFAPMPDEREDTLQSLLEAIKEKKAQYTARLEAERVENLQKKLGIIAELNLMADDTDNVNRHYQRFRELSQAFKEIGEVPPTEQTDLWRNYQTAVERFYDQLKVNKDLRDYDFKKNLEIKQLLIPNWQMIRMLSQLSAVCRNYMTNGVRPDR